MNFFGITGKRLTAATPLRQAPLGNLKESNMSIKIGDKIRYSVTNEEGAVVAISNNTSCAAVQFGNSFAYLVATKELELVAIPTRAAAHRLTMSNAIPKECMALLKEASEMFEETGCVPGIDGEPVQAQTMALDAKEYISETIDDPEAIYDPAIWDTPGFALVISWLAQKWQRKCQKLAPRGSKSPEQHLTKEQQKAYLDSAATELIREITHNRLLS
jgi:hypothetical protein